MSESEETGWRAVGGAEVGQEEKATLTEKEEKEKKEELEQRVQAKAEEIGSGGEASLIAKQEEEKVPITETKYESPSKKERKTRRS